MAGSPEITRQSVAAYNVISPTGGEVMEEVRGSYRGEEVVASSQESKIADAAEELGMSVAHRAEKRHLGQRTVRPGQASYPEALARLREALDELPDMPPERELVELIEQLQSFQDALSSGSGRSAPSKEDVLAALQGFDADVTHQYAGLEIARAHFEAAGADGAFLAVLDQARAAFETGDTAREVRAGFAVAKVATEAAATLETDPATVRETYRSMLREPMSVGQLFDAMGQFAVLKSFGEAVGTFMAAAGRDLASTGPSTDPTFLHGLLTELGKLKKMQTALEAVGDLVRTTERALPSRERGTRDVVDQTSRVLNFASQPNAGVSDARRLLGGFATAALATQVTFANGLRQLHGDIADDVMPSPAARHQQGRAIMSLLDELVAAEERTYATSAG